MDQHTEPLKQEADGAYLIDLPSGGVGRFVNASDDIGIPDAINDQLRGLTTGQSGLFWSGEFVAWARPFPGRGPSSHAVNVYERAEVTP